MIDQSPPANAAARKGSIVTIRVSTGNGRGRVPDVVGQTAVTARALLLQESFQVEIVTEESDAVAADTVIGQDPAPGTEADPGTKVTLRVAASTGKLAVPDVAGRTPDEANQTLATTGFRTSVQSESSATVAKGVVVRTDPPAGTQLEKGGAVVIYVSAGTEVAVPSVIASAEADAVARLTQLGFSVDRRTDRWPPRPTSASCWSRPRRAGPTWPPDRR